MQQNDLLTEYKRLAPAALGLNIFVYLTGSALTTFTLSLALGLLTGTALLAADLFLLYRAVFGAMGSSPGGARAKMVANYLLRLLLIGLVFVAATECSLLNPYGTVIPLLYPRLVYVWQARRRKYKNQE